MLYQSHRSVAAAVAEGKSTEKGSGGGNGTAYGVLAVTSLAVAAALAIAPHTVSFRCLHPGPDSCAAAHPSSIVFAGQILRSQVWSNVG